ncbi:hypothetical protein [Porphyromonas circumdentaria]|uniref:hypothetical protein n=1 Tax=Porphyromonas circumdentaria TaxID=29524 RepID=UPI0026DB68B3|nr:hypothetical protein [Porphyromonas circumdentaria]MDO4722780.1 hypothetical protein [Porphyromonas circumdentaria]
MREKSSRFLVAYHISWMQLLGFLFSNIVGLFIITLGIQLYQDFSALFSTQEKHLSEEYLIVSKKVHSLSTLGSVLGSSNYKRFLPEEIESLQGLKGVKQVASCRIARYQVIASISHSCSDEAMASLLSFESLPDSFLDTTPSQWSFDAEHPSIPIIIPKDFLALYNFSLAESQNLPQLSEAVIKQIPIDFQLIGDNGRVLYLKGRVVGFTQRINAFIVPEEFLRWSNSLLSSKEEQPPSRLMVEVEPNEIPFIRDRIKDLGYEVAGDTQDNRVAYLFKIALSVIVFIGLLISFLAFFLLMLSIHLILVKNRERIQTLYLIGYTPKEVGRIYTIVIWGVNLLAWLIVVMAVWGVRAVYSSYWEALAISSFNGVSLFIALLFVVTLSLLHRLFLRRKLISFWAS